MTSLEFIEKEIKECINAINEYRDKPSMWKTKLTHLQQIKAELEAWYIIKNALELTENELGEEEIEMKVFFTNAEVEVCDTRKEFEIIKKALEIK